MKYEKLFNLIEDTEYETVGIDVQYQIKKIDGILYLLFQESTSKKDWEINFDFPVKVYKKQENTILAHRGFVKAWKSCNDIIMDNFIKAITDEYKMINKIVIAGWSYGGAMAQLAAEDLHFRTHIKPVLITYGSPKILFGRKPKKYFTSCIDKESKQFANRSDLVTKVPPFYSTFNRIKLGKFNLIELFKCKIHCKYGCSDWYVNQDNYL